MKVYGGTEVFYPRHQMEVSVHLNTTVALPRRLRGRGSQSRSGTREEGKIISPLAATEPRFPRHPDVTRLYTD
jgi:hypothetical protein